MLKTECPKCKNWVDLPFHTGSKEAFCAECAAHVPVKDVHVSAGPFMIYREVLSGSLLKYKRLLAEAEKEIEGLRQKETSDTSYGVSIRSLSLFIGNLKELLDGCRYEPRHPLTEPVAVEYNLDGRPYTGKLVNMSLTGACLDTLRHSELTRLWGKISIRLRGSAGEFLLGGDIVWIGKGTLIGVKFASTDAETREFLKVFITENSRLLGK